jgi:hypothetical protein
MIIYRRIWQFAVYATIFYQLNHSLPPAMNSTSSPEFLVSLHTLLQCSIEIIVWIKFNQISYTLIKCQKGISAFLKLIEIDHIPRSIRFTFSELL